MYKIIIKKKFTKKNTYNTLKKIIIITFSQTNGFSFAT